MRRFLLALFFIAFNQTAIAIDSIHVDIGKVELNQKRITNISAEMSLGDADKPVLLALSGKSGAENTTGIVRANARIDQSRWYLKLQQDFDSQWLLAQLLLFTESLQGWSMQGPMALELSLQGVANRYLPSISNLQYEVAMRPNKLSFNNADLTIAGENIHVNLWTSGRFRQSSHGSQVLQGKFDCTFTKGLIAVHDVLVEPVKQGIRCGSQYRVDKQNIILTKNQFHDSGGLSIDVPRLVMPLENDSFFDVKNADVNLRINEAKFPYTYDAWLKPLLYGEVLEDLETSGEVSGLVNIKNGTLHAIDMAIHNFSAADRQKRFAIYDLNTHVKATEGLKDGKVTLVWRHAELHRLLFEQAVFQFDITNGSLTLSRPADIPLYGGEMKVFTFSAQNFSSSNYVVMFNGVLTPVRLSDLTTAFDWPAFYGNVAGVIPGIRIDRHGLTIDGVLRAYMFDGTVEITELEVEDLLGTVPRLSANIEVDGFDLEQLTDTFDFGRMEGRLDGRINNLQMTAWQPTAFDAFFATPEDDDKPHIISQRAVDNITSLSGSDIGSVLSRTYLRFVENFRYDRLGIGCELKNNICRMRGVEPASNSAYYLVKGGWLPPRLDIVGYSSEVDWRELLSRLKSVTTEKNILIQ